MTIAVPCQATFTPLDNAAEPFVVGVVVAPDDVPADHAGLFLVTGVVAAVEDEVAQSGELGLDPVLTTTHWTGYRRSPRCWPRPQAPTRPSLAMVRYGLKLSQMTAMRIRCG